MSRVSFNCYSERKHELCTTPHLPIEGKTHPSGNVGVNPVLPILIFSFAEVDKHGDKGGEVGKGSAGCEPELLHCKMLC